MSILSDRSRYTLPLLMAAYSAITAVTLHLMGRHWWCEAGDAGLWSGAVHTLHNSQHLFDPYTFTHILHGLALYVLLWMLGGNLTAVGNRAVVAVGLESLWEIFENTSFVIERYREGTLALGYYGDSIFNSLGDVAACGLGFWLAARVSVRSSVLVFVAIELLLLVFIRDSLLLNILMLIRPVPAIRAWQLGM